MSRLRIAVALLFGVLLLSPTVCAGTEDDPEVEDPADVSSDRSADLLAAWLTTEDGGVRFHVKVADGARRIDHLYGIQFTFGGARVDAIVGHDGSNRMLGYLGPDGGPAWARGGFERVANGKVVSLRSEGGAPATFSGVIPWGAMAGFDEGSVLQDWTAFTTRYERSRGVWPGGIDGARATPGDYVASVERPPLERAVASWGWLVVVGTTLAGAGGGWLLSRRGKTKKR